MPPACTGYPVRGSSIGKNALFVSLIWDKNVVFSAVYDGDLSLVVKMG